PLIATMPAGPFACALQLVTVTDAMSIAATPDRGRPLIAVKLPVTNKTPARVYARTIGRWTPGVSGVTVSPNGTVAPVVASSTAKPAHGCQFTDVNEPVTNTLFPSTAIASTVPSTNTGANVGSMSPVAVVRARRACGTPLTASKSPPRYQRPALSSTAETTPRFETGTRVGVNIASPVVASIAAKAPVGGPT